MSMFRRMLMSNCIEKVKSYTAKFTLKFDSTKEQNITSSFDDSLDVPDVKGVGFMLSLDSKINYEMNVIFKSKNTGEIVPHYIFDKSSSTDIYLKIVLSGIPSGLYDVELTIKPEETCVFDVKDISGTLASDGKHSTRYYCYCLYSIDKVVPDPILTNEGIKINLTEYSDDGDFIQ